MQKITFYLIAVFLSVLLFTCKKDENHKVKFGWAKNGNVFFYNWYKGPVIKKDSLKLEIISGRFFQNDIAASVDLDIYENNFVVKKGGIYGLGCNSCDFGFFSCSTTFEFLYAPNKPTAGQEIPVFTCGHTADYNIHIINADTTVTVPYGTFSTYVMKHRFGDKSYWNADHGLIMYEKVDYRDQKTVVGTYKLAR